MTFRNCTLPFLLMMLTSCVNRIETQSVPPAAMEAELDRDTLSHDTSVNAPDSDPLDGALDPPNDMEISGDPLDVSYREVSDERLVDALLPDPDAAALGDVTFPADAEDASPTNVDPCRQPIIDGNFTLLGFSYEVTLENSTLEEGCTSEINTLLIDSPIGTMTWRGVFNASQSGAQFRLTMPELTGSEACSPTLFFQGSHIRGVENLTMGLPTGMTDFVFQIDCDGRIPNILVTLEDAT